MVDNLRRTLSMPAALLTLVCGWVWPGSLPVPWTAFVLVVIAFPPLLPAFAGIWPRAAGISWRSHLRAVGRDFRAAVGQAALTLTTMAYQAWLMAHALGRTLGRLYLTHRRMLEWKTMEHAALRAPRTLGGFAGQMAGGLVLTTMAGAVLAWQRPGAAPVAVPILVLWALAPVIARWVSRPGSHAPAVQPTREDAHALRLIARHTWDYFTRFVTPGSHWLPPDNFQETPQPVVAERTSPTNIGLYLLSVVAAHDFGWEGTLATVERLEATLGTVQELEGHRGHLYNWYDTRDASPMEPKYVSSVDSGNLAGSLLTLASACREMLDRPTAGHAMLSGIADAALVLRETANSTLADRPADPAQVRRLEEALDVVLTVVAQSPGTPGEWAARLNELDAAGRTAANCAKSFDDNEAGPPSRGRSRGAARCRGDPHPRHRRAHAVGAAPGGRRGRAAHGPSGTAALARRVARTLRQGSP